MKSIGGFSHLKNKTVRVLLDGHLYAGECMQDDDTIYTDESVQVVGSDGTVQVHDLFYGTVKAGQTYETQIKTLPVSYEAAAAARGVFKNISRVFVRANGEGALNLGSSIGQLSPMIIRGEAQDDIPKTIEVPVLGEWDMDASLTITHDEPRPMLLSAMVIEVAGGG